MKKLLAFTFCLLWCIGLASAQSLKANMQINVTISGVPDKEVTRISSTYLIDESGYIRLPLLDGVKIKASGISGPKLALRIADAYKSRKIYSSPVLTITSFKNTDAENAVIQERLRIAQEKERLRLERIEETRIVHVQGEAKQPGRFKLTVGMTVRALLAECGGDSEWGSNQRFILKRGANAEKEYNYKQNPAALDIKLQPGDFIRIPGGKGLLGKK